jgi:hypothetical protein
VFIVGVTACRGQQASIEARPATYSKLAGRWSVSYLERVQEEQRSRGQEVTITEEGAGAAGEDRIIVVTILPDGGFDWSRMHFGVIYGVHSLRNPGDRCVGRRYEAGEFEVVAAEYTPTRSLIEFRGVSQDENITQTLAYARLDVELQPDDTASAQIVWDEVTGFTIRTDEAGEQIVDERSPPRRSEMTYRLQRHDSRKRKRIQNVSKIAGNWAKSRDAAKLALIIRPDGTFDWTATAEGVLGCWYQLEQKGDVAFVEMSHQRYVVLDAEYTTTQSRIRLGAEAGKVELAARQAGPNTIMLLMKADGGIRRTVTLHRNNVAAERVESNICEDW